MSDARIEHALVGLAFWILFLLARQPKCTLWEFAAMLAFAMLGTWVPDWDLFLGIGYHRSPLSHSALPVVLVGLLVSPFRGYSVSVGMGLGVASHLFWDTVEYGNVHWIPGKFWDQVFLMTNAIGIVLWSLGAKVPLKQKAREPVKDPELE
jgi:Na+/proline symporter